VTLASAGGKRSAGRAESPLEWKPPGFPRPTPGLLAARGGLSAAKAGKAPTTGITALRRACGTAWRLKTAPATGHRHQAINDAVSGCLSDFSPTPFTSSTWATY
jgi:hypothetical protein